MKLKLLFVFTFLTVILFLIGCKKDVSLNNEQSSSTVTTSYPVLKVVNESSVPVYWLKIFSKNDVLLYDSDIIIQPGNQLIIKLDKQNPGNEWESYMIIKYIDGTENTQKITSIKFTQNKTTLLRLQYTSGYVIAYQL